MPRGAMEQEEVLLHWVGGVLLRREESRVASEFQKEDGEGIGPHGSVRGGEEGLVLDGVGQGRHEGGGGVHAVAPEGLAGGSAVEDGGEGLDGLLCGAQDVLGEGLGCIVTMVKGAEKYEGPAQT